MLLRCPSLRMPSPPTSGPACAPQPSRTSPAAVPQLPVLRCVPGLFPPANLHPLAATPTIWPRSWNKGCRCSRSPASLACLSRDAQLLPVPGMVARWNGPPSCGDAPRCLLAWKRHTKRHRRKAARERCKPRRRLVANDHGSGGEGSASAQGDFWPGAEDSLGLAIRRCCRRETPWTLSSHSRPRPPSAPTHHRCKSSSRATRLCSATMHRWKRCNASYPRPFSRHLRTCVFSIPVPRWRCSTRPFVGGLLRSFTALAAAVTRLRGL